MKVYAPWRQLMIFAFAIVIGAAPSSILRSELASVASPLSALSSPASSTDLAPIGKEARAARVFALGQVSHGAGNLFTLDARIVRYLVLHDRYRVLAVEGDWAEWAEIDIRLHRGGANVSRLLEHQDFSIYRVRELAGLLEWIDAYNATHNATSRLDVVGIDFQEPARTFAFVSDYVRNHDKGAMGQIRAAAPCYSSTPSNGGTALSPQEAAFCSRALLKIGSMLQAERFGAIRTPDLELAKVALHVLAAGMPLLRAPTIAARDRMLARNTLWLTREVYPRNRVVLLAHDGHVAATRGTLSYVPMGYWLRLALGQRYYALGTAFAAGRIRARPAAGVAPHTIVLPRVRGDTVAALLLTERRPFFLDFSLVSTQRTLEGWLTSPQSFRMPGGVVSAAASHSEFVTMRLAQAFNGMIFLPTLSPSTPLR